MKIQKQKYDIFTDIFSSIDALKAFNKYFGQELGKDKLLDFIYLISLENYSIKEFTGISQVKLRNLIKEIFPDKPEGSKKLDIWILYKYQYKYCRMCDTVKSISDFTLNKSKSYGLNVQCKNCQKLGTSKTQPARQAKYRAAGLKAIVPWTDLEEIAQFYSACPEGYQVDHIIPLQGKNVCGLHVLNNLQYLTIFDNISKNNKFNIEK